MPYELTNNQIEKIGNSIVYLASRVSELSKTKLLKLLFLIEEKSIKDFGTPFFGVDFKVWQFGPVAQPIFEALTDIEGGFLKEYVCKNKFDEYEGKTEFNDDEFSNNDIRVLDWAVNFARHKIAEDLVNHTHSKNSLWRRCAIQFDVYDGFINKEITHTDFNIDFTLLFEGEKDDYLAGKYHSSLENIAFAKKYK